MKWRIECPRDDSYFCACASISAQIETDSNELLPSFHELSAYPDRLVKQIDMSLSVLGLIPSAFDGDGTTRKTLTHPSVYLPLALSIYIYMLFV